MSRYIAINSFWFFGWALLLTLNPLPAFSAALQVVATTPDLKSIAEAIGGERVTAISLASPLTNAETFQPRPQDLHRLQAAALVVRVGLDYDLWLNALLVKTGRPELQLRGKALVDASNGIALLDIRNANLDASSGHGHGAGNPHYWLDPHNAEIISANIFDGLRRVDPENEKFYRANHERFVSTLRERLRDWEKRLSPLSGKAVLAYHDNWAYFARRFRLRIVDLVEPKPGIPPSPARLTTLLKTMQQAGVQTIIVQPFDPDAMPRLLAQKSGAKVVVLVATIGALPQVQDYFSMMEFNVAALSAAYRKQP